jgi:choline dehydrogenase-like flavoprotein
MTSAQPRKVQRVFNLFHHQRRKYSVRFSLSSKCQEQEDLGNASGSVFFELPADNAIVSLSVALAHWRRRHLSREFYGRLVNLAKGAPELIPPALEYVLRGRTYKPRARFMLHAFFEQEPNPESRVMLGSDRDALGMRRSEIRWRLTELTPRTAIVFAHMIRDQFAKADVGNVSLKEWIQDPNHSWVENYADLNHHMGTTRMSSSPRHGVVNEQCRVHSVPNLYIASSAVFPTSGHSNPTLTLIALAKRLAAHLQSIN